MMNFYLYCGSLDDYDKYYEDIKQWKRRIYTNRFLGIKHIIKQSPTESFIYARDIINGRWFEAEATIMKEPKLAFHYAREIIKGRWYEAEPIIMKDPYCSPMYVHTVINNTGSIEHAYPFTAKFTIND